MSDWNPNDSRWGRCGDPETVAGRLDQLADFMRDNKKRDWSQEFHMSIPARPGHDADLVMDEAAEMIRGSAEALRARDERIAELEAEVERLRYFEPTLRDGVMRQLICAPIEMCWFAVLYAVNVAADQMTDCEDTEQFVQHPDGSWCHVDLAAGRALNPAMNIVRVNEATEEDALKEKAG